MSKNKTLHFIFLVVVFVSFSSLGIELPKDHYAESKKFMVVTNGANSTKIGTQILERGGNAVDAAIAVAFALSVELQDALGLGGGGFSLISMNGKKYFYDYRERAPAKASMHMYDGTKEDNNSATGPLSVAIPSMVKGLEVIHSQHATMPWKDLVQPAIDLAKQGMVVDQRLITSIQFRKKFMITDPELRKRFLDDHDEPFPIGTKIALPELVQTLEHIRDEGSVYMMKGKFADDVIARLGSKGILQKSDFEKYEVKLREPYVAKYKDYTMYLAPSPSSGGVALAELFNMLNYVQFGKRKKDGYENERRVIEMYKSAFFDRAKYMGDSDFIKIPEELTTAEYAKQKAELINTGENIVYDPKLVTGEKDVHTAHFNVVDGQGNIVSSTNTHNYYFGSGISVDGVVLNDEMDDFSTTPGVANAWGLIGSYKNAIEPFKTPLSSMSPTIIEKNGKFVMSIGGRGGPTIITLSFLTASRVLHDGMSPKEAFEKYYFHHQTFPNKVVVEKSDESAGFSAYLKEKGYEVDDRELAKWSGKVTMIYKDKNKLIGVADPREPGSAQGK